MDWEFWSEGLDEEAPTTSGKFDTQEDFCVVFAESRCDEIDFFFFLILAQMHKEVCFHFSWIADSSFAGITGCLCQVCPHSELEKQVQVSCSALLLVS